jgi:uncharacterized membrane protein (UPF0127 family)
VQSRWFFVLSIVALTACEHPAKPDPKPDPNPDPNHDAPVVGAPATANGPKVMIATAKGDLTVEVEVVSTEAKIERGLMYRQYLPPDAGMLFLLGIEKDWTFWMRNTLIPLDMIFIRKSMTIAGIVENAEPKTESMRTVGETSLYVLEVNGGWTRSHGVIKDAKVRFANLPGQ